ncbi:NADP-dependent phosphogluconate dehydrogenase, partial [Citrobacter sp. AAK_AS5]
NSHFIDSSRRYHALQKHGIRFIGAGISGGEQGARSGPSIMPGGDASAWSVAGKMLETIAARVDGIACCQWIGPEGAGHY